MAIRLFPLKNVPEDEVEDVRNLLLDNDIDIYETPEVFFGIFPGAIWLANEDQLEEAKSLIKDYQEKRRRLVKEELSRLKKEGKQKTMVDKIIEDPLQFIIYLAIILFIIYLSIIPFIDFGK